MRRALILFFVCLLVASMAAPAWTAETKKPAAEEKKIEVFPSSHYEQSSIYLNLAMFWMGIIGLIIILRMKLKEAERIQAFERGKKEEKEPPLLE